MVIDTIKLKNLLDVLRDYDDDFYVYAFVKYDGDLYFRSLKDYKNERYSEFYVCNISPYDFDGNKILTIYCSSNWCRM